MATPKKKTTRSRRDLRRFNPGNLPPKTTSHACPGCGEHIRPHSICTTCMKNGEECHYYQARFSKKAGAKGAAANV